MWILPILAFLLIHEMASGDLERLEACCSFGKNYLGKCEESDKPVPGIPPEQQSICLSTAHLCCSHQLRKVECEEGKKAAKTGGNCPDKETSDEQNCCESCKLGLITGSMGHVCTLGNVSFGQIWDEAFKSCCEDTKRSLSPRSPRPQVLVGNVCQLLPGELCAHICVPSGNSYKCLCQQGFELMSDGKSCEQVKKAISKCSDGNPCAHVCTDTEVGYVCSCHPGYRLSSDNTECNRVDDCSKNRYICNLEKESCIATSTGYRCVTKQNPISTCPSGFRFSRSSQQCTDIDECTELEENPCDSNQICINSEGSFMCECRPGFQLDNITHACIDINECQLSLHECLPSQRCDNTIGSYQCIRFINCGTGYTLNGETGQCEDDNECLLGTHHCKQLGEGWQCRNTLGSFRCEQKSQVQKPPETLTCKESNCIHQVKCPKGYRPFASMCIDINECEESSPCGIDTKCINTPGSFRCANVPRCQGGFRLNDAKTHCIDIDECQEQRGICGQNCINVWGSFMCTCRSGYTLNDDNRTCSDVNECELYKDRRLCMGYCTNQLGSYSCQCPQGYRLSANGASCEDIDECSTNQSICATKDEMCLNMRGSHRCIPMLCPPGYVRDYAQKNRCTREKLTCLEGDKQCLHEPLSYSFHFITLVSSLSIPSSGKIDLFSMRGPLWASTTVDFTLDLIRARAPTGVEKATRSAFILTRSAHNQAGIALVKTLEGPQDINLQLTMEFYNNGLFGGKTISNIDIYVSQYSF